MFNRQNILSPLFISFNICFISFLRLNFVVLFSRCFTVGNDEHCKQNFRKKFEVLHFNLCWWTAVLSIIFCDYPSIAYQVDCFRTRSFEILGQFLDCGQNLSANILKRRAVLSFKFLKLNKMHRQWNQMKSWLRSQQCWCFRFVTKTNLNISFYFCLPSFRLFFLKRTLPGRFIFTSGFSWNTPFMNFKRTQ